MAIDLASLDVASRLMPGVKANESGDTPDDQVQPGDGGKSRGAYQVSAGALEDVNKAFGTKYTAADLDKPAVNKDVAQKYLTLQVQRFGPRAGLEAYNAGPTRVAAGDVPPSSVDYAARALNVGGAGNMDALGADAAQFKQMMGTPDSSWLAPLISNLNANRTAEKAELEGVQRGQEADYQTDRARVKTAYDAADRDDTTPWTQKPPPPETLQAFGSAGAIFAAIASAFTRTPAISAMNGMAAAINARRSGDQKAYEDAYKAWQDNTKLAIDRQKMASEKLTEALELMKTDSAHGFAQAKQIMQEHGDDRGLLLLEAGQLQHLGEANDARTRAAMNMAINYQKILHPTAKPQILTDPGTKDDQGNPVQYIWNQGVTGPGQFTTLTGEPYTPKGAQKVGTPTQTKSPTLNQEQAKAVEEAVAGGTDRAKAIRQVTGAEDKEARQALRDTEKDRHTAWLEDFQSRKFTSDSERQAAVEAERQRHNAALEGFADKRLELGRYDKPALVQTVDDKGFPTTKFAQEDKSTGQWVTADETRTPIQNVKGVIKAGDDVGPDDPSVHTTAQMIGTYRLPGLTSYVIARQPKFSAAVNEELTKSYPGYRPSEYAARNAAARTFAAGPVGNQIQSVNTAVAHLGTAMELASALYNGDIQAVNRLKQEFKEQFGQDAPTNFNLARQIVGQEIVKAIVLGGGGVTERQDAQSHIDSAESPEQLQGAATTAKSLLAGQLRSAKKRYEGSVGATDFEDRFLLPETRKELQLLPPTKDGEQQGGAAGVGKAVNTEGHTIILDPARNLYKNPDTGMYWDGAKWIP